MLLSKIIDEETKRQLKSILRSLVSSVSLFFFTQKNACPTCIQQQQLLEELTSLSDKLQLKTYDFVLHGDEARNYKIDKIPATAVVGKKDYGISIPVRGKASASKNAFNNLHQTLSTKQKKLDIKFEKIATDDGLYKSYD